MRSTCAQATTYMRKARALRRVTIEPGPGTGLRVRSQVMVDKSVTIRRERISQRIGQLGAADIARLNAALGFVMGLAD
jgi:mRNA interferase MazF